MFTDKDKEDFLKLGFTKKIKPKTVQIKINDEFVVMSSGKSTWSSIGAAKSALTNHCYYFINDLNAKYHKYDGRSELEVYHEFIKYLQDEGVLEFVVFESDEN